MRVVDIVLAAGEENITPAQFTAICGAFLASAEDTHLQHREGLLSDAVFASFTESRRRTLSQPGVRAVDAPPRDLRIRIQGVHGPTDGRGPCRLGQRLPGRVNRAYEVPMGLTSAPAKPVASPSVR